jgi:hypothetical protein
MSPLAKLFNYGLVILGLVGFPSVGQGQFDRLSRAVIHAPPSRSIHAPSRSPVKHPELLGAALTNDTSIAGFRNVPQVQDTFYSCRATECALVTVYLGRNVDTLTARLNQSRDRLISYLDRNRLPAVRYHFDSAYPQVPWTRINYSLSGRRYVSQHVADSLSNAVAAINSQLRQAASEDLITLRVDVLPVGANVFVQALRGDLHSTVANHPLGGLWLGKYNYWVRVGTQERFRGTLNFWDHPGRVLRCRFDDPGPGLGGCAQVRN